MMKILYLMIFCWSVSLDKLKAEIKYFDLGYDYKENETFYFIKDQAFKRTPYKVGPDVFVWFSMYSFFMGEHGGTHIDAPLHAWQNAWSVDEIPLERLLNLPLVVVNVTEKVEKDPDYAYTVEDFVEWEQKNGLIPEGSVVLVKSGWSKYYPDDIKFTGSRTDNITGKQVHHFPGFHADAATFLSVERKVYGVGTESGSLDNAGAGRSFPAHLNFFKNSVWGLEMVRNMDGIPATGARVSVLPLKTKRGTGGPSRVIVTWVTDGGVRCGGYLVSVLGVALFVILNMLY